jgi:ATP-dependent Clp protease protease subunit
MNEPEDHVQSRLDVRLLRARTIVISEPVTDKLAQRVLASLLLLDAEAPDEPILVVINCPGGEIYNGLAIYDTMRTIRSPIRTVCTGHAASMGSILLLAGEKGHRYVLPNCRTLIHQPRGGMGGDATDIRIQAKEILTLRERLNRILAEETGQPLERVEKDVDRDYWMSAEEAVEYGLFDRIVESLAEVREK